MPILPGKRLGPYEILSSIGAGGMGEVDRACDTRLDRNQSHWAAMQLILQSEDRGDVVIIRCRGHIVAGAEVRSLTDRLNWRTNREQR